MLPASDPATAIVPIDGNKPPLPSSPPKGKKKKTGAMSFFRAALFMWKSGGTGKKSKPSLQIEVAAASADMINKVVGSMRPLHAQGGESPVHFSHIERPDQSPMLYPPSPSMTEFYEDVSQSPYNSASSSPFRARIRPSPSTSSLTSEGTVSRFASALNLLDLDNNSDDEESDDDVDGKLETAPEDEMIDSKAEEFISRFYEQMKIQNHTQKLRRSGCQKY